MLNRIRRAFSLTRVRNSPRGRHRRPLVPAFPPPPLPGSRRPDGTSPPGLGHTVDDAASHLTLLRGEDVALVRPYVLAMEGRVRTRAMVIAPHLSADAWSALTGAH
ncbi:hypothetical protein KVH02_33255 [Streptomyces olivaceus]|uniref:Uncharacterized protein n=1 Tax=Streptomyces olivaceus TaxID=47716 RepID=A0ABS7WDE7_STROV|nr:hypothetical protein [Streptomyces olivaceus]MBZ6100233.1 hypothetical protein [Streptomyces olivaceus]MBZ6121299.1 hypothetical protein [Streptomyces olivaceus]MBZ6155978.1 hypothetical protein [Streptomyces olivaceus]MBZ6302590.1 hypothetical protein [Streptomyces olivaceus]